MDCEATWALTLRIADIELLQGLLGVTCPGIHQGPESLGPPMDGQRAQLDQARRNLVAHGYLRIGPGGSWGLDAAIVAILDGLGKADHVAAMSQCEWLAARRTRLIYISTDVIIEQEALGDDEVSLTAVRDAQAVRQRAIEFIALPDSPAAPGPGFILGESVMREVRCLGLGGDADAARELLLETGVSREAAAALSAALAGGPSTGSITVLDGKGRPVVGDSMAWLASSQSAWIVRDSPADGTGHVEMLPASSVEIVSRLTDLIWRLCSAEG